MPFSALLEFTVLILEALIGGKAELSNRDTARRVLDFWIFADVSDKNDFVTLFGIVNSRTFRECDAIMAGPARSVMIRTNEWPTCGSAHRTITGDRTNAISSSRCGSGATVAGAGSLISDIGIRPD